MKTNNNFNSRISCYNLYKDDWHLNVDRLCINVLNVEGGMYISDSNLMYYIEEIYSGSYVRVILSDKGNTKHISSNPSYKPAIFLEADTGKGKTHFITNDLRKFVTAKGQTILYLVNRDAVALQQKHELLKHDNSVMTQYERYDKNENWLRDFNGPIAGVIVMTYQKFYAFPMSELRKYDIAFVISDEAHYYISDSTFVGETYWTLKKLIREYCTVPRIYISATADEIIPILTRYELCLQKCPDYPDTYLQENEFYNLLYFGFPKICRNYKFSRLSYSSENETMFNYIGEIFKNIKAKEKTVIFVMSKEFGRKLKDFINNNCNRKAVYIDNGEKGSDTYNEIITNDKFNEDVLITTSVLDNGVNIKDYNFKNIIILHLDAIKYVQAIGRKRFEKDECLNVWLPNFDKSYLIREKHKLNIFLKELELARKDPYRYVIDRYLHDRMQDIGQEVKCISLIGDKYEVNPLAYDKLKFSSAFIDKILKNIESDPDACIKAQLELLHAEDHYEHLGYNKAEWALYKKLGEYSKYGYMPEPENILDKLEIFLDKYLGKSSNARHDRDFSLKMINNRLERHNIPFKFKEQNGYIAVIKGEISSEEGESE